MALPDPAGCTVDAAWALPVQASGIADSVSTRRWTRALSRIEPCDSPHRRGVFRRSAAVYRLM